MKSLLTVVFISLAGRCMAQPRVELKAFSQVFTPGMVRQRDIPAENGAGSGKQALENIQYRIYAITAHGDRPVFRQLWIKGQWYQIRRYSIRTPSLQGADKQNNKPIPVTKQQLILIEPGDSMQKAPVLFPALRQMLKHSQLLVSYSWKGKMYYRSLSKIIELEKVDGE